MTSQAWRGRWKPRGDRPLPGGAFMSGPTNAVPGAVLTMATALAPIVPVHAAGDIDRGARAARVCMACHSFSRGPHLTVPCLSGVWGCKAGTAEGFGRYSHPLKRSGLAMTKRVSERHLAATRCYFAAGSMAVTVMAPFTLSAENLTLSPSLIDSSIVGSDTLNTMVIPGMSRF